MSKRRSTSPVEKKPVITKVVSKRQTTIINNKGAGGTRMPSVVNQEVTSGVTSQETVEKKPFITINVKTNQDQSAVAFRIRRTSQLERVMKAYCENKAVAYNTYRFLYNGRRIHSTQTADQLEMEDEDEIDAFLLQHGGF